MRRIRIGFFLGKGARDAKNGGKRRYRSTKAPSGADMKKEGQPL